MHKISLFWFGSVDMDDAEKEPPPLTNEGGISQRTKKKRRTHFYLTFILLSSY